MAPSFVQAVLAISLLSIAYYATILRKVDPMLASRPMKPQAHSEIMDAELRKYKDVIGADYDGYRNHIHRVLTYSMHFMTDESGVSEEYTKYLPVIEKALVYHDIAVWTDKQLDYLEPSSARAMKRYEGEHSGEDLQLMHDIIYWHHKVTPFVGPHADIVNAVRKADWVDASMGLVNHGMSGEHIKQVNSVIPNAGFHVTLATVGPRYYGFNVPRIVTELSSIFKW